MPILGLGTDIVECLRIAQMIERHGELFINRVYTDLEIEYCAGRKAATQHYAGRWAAKEAILNGLTGFVEVNGQRYNSVMPPMGHLKDDEIADILTYVRQSSGNEGDAVSANEVAVGRGGASH